MRFLVDECTGPAVARWLQSRGHEVYSVFDEARGSTDSDIIDKAYDGNFVIITNDRDFGEKVYRERSLHRGVIFLRLEDERAENKILVLQKLIDNYADRLNNQFVVVSDTRIRFASS